MAKARLTPVAALERFIGHQGDPLPLFIDLVGAMRPRPIHDLETGRRHYAELLDTLRSRDDVRHAVRDQLQRLFATRKLVTFFTDTGILPASGFFSELSRRIFQRILPEAPDERSLRDCLRLIFSDSDDYVWLGAIPAEQSREFWRLMNPVDRQHPEPVRKAMKEMLDAVQILSHRVSAMGIEQELLRVVPELDAFESPFLTQTDETHQFVAAYRAAFDGREAPAYDAKQLYVLIDQCRDVLKRARRTAAREGTSLRLTYLMYRLAQSLDRLEMLVRLLSARFEATPDQAALIGWSDFFRGALRAESQRNSPSRHVSRMLSMLALRVTDNAGRTGEHYITTDWPGYREMWRSAMGAGFIIAFMALLKIYASKLGLAPMNQAFVFSMNYALGFVLIHMLHFTIATKQPAMTAATIAGAVSESQSRGDLGRLADLIVDVLRSQFAAILGNVSIAFPTAVALAYTVSYITGHPFLDGAKAFHLLHELNPIASLAIPHAAIAGVCLFLSGLISGYFDNRAVYDRIPERIARLPWLRAIAGRDRAARAGTLGGREPRRPRRQLLLRHHARLDGHRRPAVRPAARHPPHRLRGGELRLRAGRARLRPAVAGVRDGRAGRRPDRPHQPDGQLRAGAVGRAARARHRVRADPRTARRAVAPVHHGAGAVLPAADGPDGACGMSPLATSPRRGTLPRQ